MSENTTEYTPKTGTCATCGEHIAQWRQAPEASYMHTKTGLFACEPKFWKKTMAEPMEAA